MGRRKLGFHPSKMSEKELKVYVALGNIHGRCNNPKHPAYKDYGDRGLTVCDRYSFTPEGWANLIADIGLPPTMKHTIDRINNDLGYIEGNIRWATRFEQTHNRRKDVVSSSLSIAGKIAMNKQEVKAKTSAAATKHWTQWRQNRMVQVTWCAL